MERKGRDLARGKFSDEKFGVPSRVSGSPTVVRQGRSSDGSFREKKTFCVILREKERRLDCGIDKCGALIAGRTIEFYNTVSAFLILTQQLFDLHLWLGDFYTRASRHHGV